MNPFAKISYEEVEIENDEEVFDKFEELLKAQPFSSMAFGLTTSFERAVKLNQAAYACKIPFYCLKASGLNAFMYSDLASDKFEF